MALRLAFGFGIRFSPSYCPALSSWRRTMIVLSSRILPAEKGYRKEAPEHEKTRTAQFYSLFIGPARHSSRKSGHASSSASCFCLSAKHRSMAGRWNMLHLHRHVSRSHHRQRRISHHRLPDFCHLCHATSESLRTLTFLHAWRRLVRQGWFSHCAGTPLRPQHMPHGFGQRIRAMVYYRFRRACAAMISVMPFFLYSFLRFSIY